MQRNIPWTEKYRPNEFDNIILEKNNKLLFNIILEKNCFTNLLLHGPPGTGKTTTIINLIKKYQNRFEKESKSLIIHLNASDERGIDIIRNNLFNFVNTECLFNVGTKFVILDEVDYMTRTAQLALKCLIQEYNNNIKYCLICNYISKIELSLQNEFIKVRFNQLSKDNIYNYINNILINEKTIINKEKIYDIINFFDYDIRSMINYIQSNINNKICIPKNNIYSELFYKNINNDFNSFNKLLIGFEKKYLINKSIIVKNYINYIVANFYYLIINDYIMVLENIIHNNDNYMIENLIFYLVIEINKDNKLSNILIP
tara:strand:- start:421 stop:1368 length:948 start_codon:yes stop_codon:yes gene_type:complete